MEIRFFGEMINGFLVALSEESLGIVQLLLSITFLFFHFISVNFNPEAAGMEPRPYEYLW